MKTIILKVRGNPIAQKRHRTGRFSNYDPSAGDKADLVAAVQQQAPTPMITSAIILEITLYIERPRSHYGTGKNTAKLKDSAPIFVVTRPDIDNYAKFIMDALNGKFWKDDAQIIQLVITKRYSEIPGTQIRVIYDFYEESILTH